MVTTKDQSKTKIKNYFLHFILNVLNILSRPTEATNPRIYERPYKPNPNANRPVSSQVTKGGFSYIHPNKPLSQSETNLYYTDVALRPPVGPSTKSSLSNSYLSVYAEVNFY